LKVKELSVELAKANLLSVDTGEKPEMEKLIRSKMEALNNEIEQIQTRLELLTVVSPIAGRILIDHGSMIQTVISQSNETIVKIVSNEKPIGLMPIRIKHRSAISTGNQVTFRKLDTQGKIVLVNNIAQISVSSPYLFYVVDLDEYQDYTFGEIQDVVVHGAKIPFTTFLNLHLSH
jgi:hypothetical protein